MLAHSISLDILAKFYWRFSTEEIKRNSVYRFLAARVQLSILYVKIACSQSGQSWWKKLQVSQFYLVVRTRMSDCTILYNRIKITSH